MLGAIENPSPDSLTIDVEEIRRSLPELPQAMQRRFRAEYGLTQESAFLLTGDRRLASYTEQVFAELWSWLETIEGLEGTAEEVWEKEKKKLSKLVSGWLTTELFKLMNESGQVIQDVPITAENFAEFITIVYQNKVNSSAAQVLLREMFTTGKDPSVIIEENDLRQVDDTPALETVVAGIIEANPEVIKDFMGGKDNALQYLVGQAMKATKGKANPEKLQELFRAKLRS